jgi:F-type H+-transporting ATPase subunit b
MAYHFLMADSGFAGLFTALGLNRQAFLLNTAAFLVTAYIVGRFVFPPLTRALDAKKDELEATARHEQDAQAALEKAEKKAADLIAAARVSADEIIATAHADAAEQLDEARAKAAAQTERIVAESREQLDRDVQAARRELKADAAKLVASAAGTLIGEKLDDKRDAAIIGRSLEAK